MAADVLFAMPGARADVARREIEAVLADIDAHPWPDDIHEARILYDEMGPPIASDIRVEPLAVAGIRGQMLHPPGADPDRVVLFLHGGGYVYGSLASHGGMAAEVARSAGSRCLQLDYRLAPEHPFPAAVEDARAAVQWLLAEGVAPERLVIVGDSAGGGLVIATLLSLREGGHPLPAGAVCISPWFDLEGTGDSYTTRQALDPMIEPNLVAKLAALYLQGADPRTPTASPIHADLRGLPPLLVQVGEREVLFSEAETFAERARDVGVDVIFEEWAEMVHVWHLYYPMLTAGREAIARVGVFVRRCAGASHG